MVFWAEMVGEDKPLLSVACPIKVGRATSQICWTLKEILPSSPALSGCRMESYGVMSGIGGAAPAIWSKCTILIEGLEDQIDTVRLCVVQALIFL